MDPILIGYCAKIVAEPPEWLETEAVEEICSVSNCVSHEPDGFADANPARNAMWLFPSETAASASVKPPDDIEDFDIFAYKLLPIVFGDEGEQLELEEGTEQSAYDSASRTAEPLPPDFELLGYDCPNKGSADWPQSGFECSPLSCNGMAAEIQVNAYCLLDTLAEALVVASRFGKEQPEPGGYYVVEVWRKSRG
ncbi:MAG: hypothetical protein ABL893_04655 [Hyphomicrobium sp.]|nr:hypothetical protein [Hyphomicrobium sp.]